MLHCHDVHGIEAGQSEVVLGFKKYPRTYIVVEKDTTPKVMLRTPQLQPSEGAL